MKKLLIISYSHLKNDPRILKQVEALKNDFLILTIGKSSIDDKKIVFYNTININKNTIIPLAKKKFFYKIKRRLTRSYSEIINDWLNLDFIIGQNIETPDIIIANDWNGMALASELKKTLNWNDVKIYFDAHEYAPTEYDSYLKWRIFKKPLVIWALRKCKNDISAMSTVSEGIAKKYEKFFNFNYGFVKIISNASVYQEFLKPIKTNNMKIRLIHHGISQKERKMELMIKMMKFLDPSKFELNFMITRADPVYFDFLVEISKKYNNIYFIEPVINSDITNKINCFDIGIYILCPTSFNFKHALPNKFFEFIQARLAIAICPSIEMSKIVKKYELGVVSKFFTPKSLANSIKQLTPEKIMKYKSNSDLYAKKLSAEDNLIKIRSIVKELT